MHEMCELIMSPTNNAEIEKTVEKIMASFQELEHCFYDYYVIGGRFSGGKRKATLNVDKLNKFYERLKELKVTVSSFVCGKQTLNPESQIPMVDKLWKEMFPESNLDVCPLFSHFNDPYKHSINEDVWKFEDLLLDMYVSIVIFAFEGKARYILQKEFWNGINYQDTKWDGTIKQALEMYKSNLDMPLPEKDWLCITLDCHS